MRERIYVEFPSLRDSDHEETSQQNWRYNCIAWAAGDDGRWWWPTGPNAYWPPKVPRQTTVAAFLAAFALIGYQPCEDGSHEHGFEKIALYTSNGEPTHAARQLPNGQWTSKLGPQEDIRHAELAAIEGRWYGGATVFMKRPIALLGPGPAPE